MPVLSATDCSVAQLHSMSIRIPPIARGNLRKIQKGQEVKSDILHATLNGLQCIIKTVERKKKNRNNVQITPPSLIKGKHFPFLDNLDHFKH